MSALIKALDSHTPVQIGENGHTELSWSNDIESRITQFDFQCVRSDQASHESLSNILSDLLHRLSNKKTEDPELEQAREDNLVILYKIICLIFQKIHFGLLL